MTDLLRPEFSTKFFWGRDDNPVEIERPGSKKGRGGSEIAQTGVFAGLHNADYAQSGELSRLLTWTYAVLGHVSNGHTVEPPSAQ